MTYLTILTYLTCPTSLLTSCLTYLPHSLAAGRADGGAAWCRARWHARRAARCGRLRHALPRGTTCHLTLALTLTLTRTLALALALTLALAPAPILILTLTLALALTLTLTPALTLTLAANVRTHSFHPDVLTLTQTPNSPHSSP